MRTCLPCRSFSQSLKPSCLAHLSWFVCSQDVGAEKPDPAIFDAAFEQARFWIPGADLRKCTVTG